MKFSICIPTYPSRKRIPFIKKALKSVFGQTHKDFEIIIKDGNIDFPLAGCIGLFHPKIRYIVSEDSGIYSGLNEALRRASGDIFYYMNDDDLLPDNNIFEMVNDIFSKESAPFWIHGKCLRINEKDDTIGTWGHPTTFNDLIQCNQIAQPSVFWNREIFNKVGFFDETYSHAGDYDFWIRLHSITPPRFLDKTLGAYREWGETDSQRNKKFQDEEASEISKKYRLIWI